VSVYYLSGDFVSTLGSCFGSGYKASNVTSPLAEIFYSQFMFPNCAHCRPKSLQELIQKVNASMSASVLRQSVIGTDNFPKKAVFQHLFMTGLLALYTTPTC
jgi:hypothetical protein